MSDTAIRVENLGKKYVLGQQQQGAYRYTALRDVISDRIKSLGRSFRKPNHQRIRPAQEEFWALKDVSFEVKQGEVVGIIGRNGAGKSTLLKILSRITEPTSGRIHLKGRVASLLEVGTGFHPELTGRENIFLNGAILGMSKAEINRKFDEIVEFAEISQFLDTPVKRYSSGMYVRLAFTVAAHLEPEVLILDEVLAVGDFQFQQKCFSKMKDVGEQGKTIILVSHQMGSVIKLCSRALLLESGKMVSSGETQKIVSQYLENFSSSYKATYTSNDRDTKEIFISDIQPLKESGETSSTFFHNEAIKIKITCRINEWLDDTVLGFFVRDHKERKIFTSNNSEWERIKPSGDKVESIVVIPSNFLVPGTYFITFAVSIHHRRTIDIAQDALTLTVVDGGSYFSSYEGNDYGCVFANCKWTVNL